MKRIGWRLRRKYRLRRLSDSRLRLLSPTRTTAARDNKPSSGAQLAAEAYVRRLMNVAPTK